MISPHFAIKLNGRKGEREVHSGPTNTNESVSDYVGPRTVYTCDKPPAYRRMETRDKSVKIRSGIIFLYFLVLRIIFLF